MPGIKSLANNNFMNIEKNREGSHVINKSVVEKIAYISPQVDDRYQLLFEEGCTGNYENKKNQESDKNHKLIKLKKIVKFIVGLTVFSGGIAIYRMMRSTNNSDITSMTDAKNEIGYLNRTLLMNNKSSTLPFLEHDFYNHERKRVRKDVKNINHPYRYYYTEQQPEKCKTKEMKEKCRKTHLQAMSTGRYFNRLILKIGKINCFCPPPPVIKNIEIISPRIVQSEYYYTDKQPDKCKTEEIKEKCRKTHDNARSNGVYYTHLILKIGETNCFCPPPDDNILEGNERKLSYFEPKGDENKIIEVKDDKKEYVFFISKKEKKSLLPNKQKKEKTEEWKPDDVAIKKLYDYSCVEGSQVANISSILRTIGESLAKPVTEMTLQIKTQYQYQVLHLGCPSPQEKEEVKNMTKDIDAMLSTTFQMLPKGKWLALLQNIVSPLFIAAADYMDGRELNFSLFQQVNQNSIFMFLDVTRSLTLNDYISNKKLGAKIKKEQLGDSDVVLYEDAKIKIPMGGNNYVLNHDPSGVPYILESDNVIIVGYDKSLKQWSRMEGDESVIYSRDNLKYINDYGVSIDYIDTEVEVVEESNADEIINHYHENGFSQYVFTCGKLIEVESNIVKGKTVFTTTREDLAKKIIRKNRFDWYFENDSAVISEPLKIFLEKESHGESLTKGNLFSLMESNGVSYNEKSESYLKCQGEYYYIYPDGNEEGQYFFYTKYNEKIDIVKDDVGFKFKWRTEIPIGINTELCGPTNSPNEQLRIDEDAYEFLKFNARMLDFDNENIEEVFKGVYQDVKNNNYLFFVGDDAFAVSKYNQEENSIYIESLSDAKNTIKLYVFDDLIIRERMRDIKEEYVKVKNCQYKRDLTESGCLPTYMSESLKNKLDAVAKKSTHLNIDDEGLVSCKDMPGCFINENKLYFYHEGFLFKAKVSYLRSLGVNIKTRIVDLYIGTFLRRSKHVASFVIDVKDNKIELKEPSVFLAEKTGVNIESCEHFIKNKKYYEIPNFIKLEDMVSEVNKHGKLNIVELPKKIISTISDDKIVDLCHAKFFPSIIEADFTILSLDLVKDTDPFYFRASKVMVLSGLRQAKHMIRIALDEFYNFSENAEFYLKAILHTERTDIAKEFSSHLHKKFTAIYNNLDRKNIRLVSINRKSMLEEPDEFYFFQAELNVELRHKGTFAFATLDDSKKIYLSIDKLYFADPEHPDPSLREVAAMDMVDTLIHETTHLDSHTTDLFYLQRDSQGHMYPILDEVDRFLASITKLQGKQSTELSKINKQYFNKVKVYKAWEDDLLNDKETLIYFAHHDTGILANYYLHNADFMTKIVRDIYQNSFVDRPPLSYLEKIGRKLNLG